MTREDFEVNETGTFSTLCDKDIVIEELKEGLRYIVNMDSCLLAHAREVAQNLLEKHSHE